VNVQESLYQEAVDRYGSALQRVARACESGPRQAERPDSGDSPRTHISSETARTTCLAFYRDEQERRLAIARQPAWQLLTALVIIAWLTRSAPMRTGMDVLHIVQLLVLLAAADVVLLAMRKLEARRIQQDIHALDAVELEEQ